MLRGFAACRITKPVFEFDAESLGSERLFQHERQMVINWIV
jgi:hypothetical protein